jgi:pectinesterase
VAVPDVRKTAFADSLSLNAKITSVSGVSLSEDVYLGRPWRVLARVIYQYSTLTDVVAPKGWTTLAADATP